MELIHLPAVRRRSLETLAHTALSVLHRSLAGPMPHSCSTRATPHCCRS